LEGIGSQINKKRRFISFIAFFCLFCCSIYIYIYIFHSRDIFIVLVYSKMYVIDKLLHLFFHCFVAVLG
jgi:hypothetical protein